MFTDRDLEIGYDTSEAVVINGSDEDIEITSEGVYIITGNVNGQVIIDVTDTQKVQLVLKDAVITNKTSAAIYVKNADKVFVTLEGSNTVSTTGTFEAIDENTIDGAIFSKSDITFNGEGTLTVNCSNGNGIVCKDDLKITSGTYNITAGNDGIQANDSVRIADGTINITATCDGIQAANEEDESEGYIYIANGKINIETGQKSSTQSTTAKGLKATGDIIILAGEITVDSSDDSIHSNANVNIQGGTITVTSADDGIHADSTVYIADGNVTVVKSYEGIEGQNIIVTGGTIDVTASDDGFNAAGGNDSSSTTNRQGMGMNAFDSDESALIQIDGGTITVNASGDGIDSNGYIYFNGGDTVVYGPTDNGNGALDFGIAAYTNGGTLIALGASGMAESIDESSSQCAMLVNLSSQASSGETVTLTDSKGNVILETTAKKSFNSVYLSSPDITKGSSYTLTTNSQETSITMSSTIYSNAQGMGGMGGMGGQGKMR